MSGLLQEYVAEQADREPDAVALVMGDERLSYEQLETASNRLARLLVQVGCGAADRVCLLGEKSPAVIVGMLATLKAGCAYVPIDTTSPAARVARIVRSAEPAAALVLGSAVGLVERLRITGAVAADLPIGALDAETMSASSIGCAFGPEDVAVQAGEHLPSTGASTDAAHILFTSGSTGEPKGVVSTHGNVSAFVEWATSFFGTRPGDRVSGHPPLHFDLSTFDIYATFRAGAELHLVPPRTLLPHQLASFISASQTDPVVLRTVDDDLHGKARCGARGWLSDTRARAVVRRGATHPGAHSLDAARTSGPIHKPLRPDRGDDREQLLHHPRDPFRRDRADPDR